MAGTYIDYNSQNLTKMGPSTLKKTAVHERGLRRSSPTGPCGVVLELTCRRGLAGTNQSHPRNNQTLARIRDDDMGTYGIWGGVLVFAALDVSRFCHFALDRHVDTLFFRSPAA